MHIYIDVLNSKKMDPNGFFVNDYTVYLKNSGKRTILRTFARPSHNNPVVRDRVQSYAEQIAETLGCEVTASDDFKEYTVDVVLLARSAEDAAVFINCRTFSPSEMIEV